MGKIKLFGKITFKRFFSVKSTYSQFYKEHHGVTPKSEQQSARKISDDYRYLLRSSSCGKFAKTTFLQKGFLTGDYHLMIPLALPAKLTEKLRFLNWSQVNNISAESSRKTCTVMACTLWTIYKARNNLIFKNFNLFPLAAIKIIHEVTQSFFKQYSLYSKSRNVTFPSSGPLHYHTMVLSFITSKTT